MKLSENTISVLKNFSQINMSIKINVGSTLSTMSPSKTILSKATVEDMFDRSFCIYELPKFLGIVSLMDSPDFTFNEDHMIIRSGNHKVRYGYCAENLIVAAPDKEINFPNPEVTFDLTQAALATIVKATGIMQLPEIAIVGEDGNLYLRAVNSKDRGSDEFNVALGETSSNFTVIFKPEYLIKISSGDYVVELTSKKLARFTGGNYTYWIATESSSNFD